MFGHSEIVSVSVLVSFLSEFLGYGEDGSGNGDDHGGDDDGCLQCLHCILSLSFFCLLSCFFSLLHTNIQLAVFKARLSHTRAGFLSAHYCGRVFLVI